MELTEDWRKSSYSGGSGSANCVETGTVPGAVLVRDTKECGDGVVLRVSPEDWKRFTALIKG